jgi:hypothetical protein
LVDELVEAIKCGPVIGEMNLLKLLDTLPITVSGGVLTCAIIAYDAVQKGLLVINETNARNIP